VRCSLPGWPSNIRHPAALYCCYCVCVCVAASDSHSVERLRSWLQSQPNRATETDPQLFVCMDVSVSDRHTHTHTHTHTMPQSPLASFSWPPMSKHAYLYIGLCVSKSTKNTLTLPGISGHLHITHTHTHPSAHSNLFTFSLYAHIIRLAEYNATKSRQTLKTTCPHPLVSSSSSSSSSSRPRIPSRSKSPSTMTSRRNPRRPRTKRSSTTGSSPSALPIRSVTTMMMMMTMMMMLGARDEASCHVIRTFFGDEGCSSYT